MVACSFLLFQDYEELIELASKGNPKNVDIYTEDLMKTVPAVDDTDDTFYSRCVATTSSILVFCFGKCVEAKLGNLFLSQFLKRLFKMEL